MKTKIKNNNYAAYALIVLILALLFALPSFTEPYTVVLLKTIFMFIILTISWTLFSGSTGYVSLATAVFYGAGLYTAGVLGKLIPLPLMVLCGGLVSVVLAIIIGSITLRLKGIYFSIFTLSTVELIKHLAHWYEINIAQVRGRYVPLVSDDIVYYVVLGILALLILTMYLVRRSKYGLALSSIGSCEEAAAHIGVDVMTMKVGIFAISAFFVGITGSIMATGMLYVDAYVAFDLNYSFFPTLMAIFGGMSSIFGPLVGAAAFAYLREILITGFPYHYMLIFGLVMVLTILYLPNGLVGLIQTVRNKITRPDRSNSREISGGKHADTSS